MSQMRTTQILEQIVNDGVKQSGNMVVEQLTQADADENDVLTFSEDIQAIEIYHENSVLQTFVVNGISLDIAQGGWRSPIGGTPSVEVTIPVDLDCTVARLI